MTQKTVKQGIDALRMIVPVGFLVAVGGVEGSMMALPSSQVRAPLESGEYTDIEDGELLPGVTESSRQYISADGTYMVTFSYDTSAMIESAAGQDGILVRSVPENQRSHTDNLDGYSVYITIGSLEEGDTYKTLVSHDLTMASLAGSVKSDPQMIERPQIAPYGIAYDVDTIGAYTTEIHALGDGAYVQLVYPALRTVATEDAARIQLILNSMRVERLSGQAEKTVELTVQH